MIAGSQKAVLIFRRDHLGSRAIKPLPDRLLDRPLRATRKHDADRRGLNGAFQFTEKIRSVSGSTDTAGLRPAPIHVHVQGAA